MGDHAVCQFFFDAFYKRYQTLGTLDKMRQKVIHDFAVNTISQETYEHRLNVLDISESRMKYLHMMAKQYRLFIHVDSTGQEHWTPLQTPADYYNAINYLIDEFPKVMTKISSTKKP